MRKSKVSDEQIIRALRRLEAELVRPGAQRTKRMLSR
jgi:hypothetical protein